MFDMAEYALYKLEKTADNPKYEGFAFVRQGSIRGKVLRGYSRPEWDFLPDDTKTEGRAWTVTRMADVWTPQPVIGRVRSFNDYPCVNLIIPAFSRRAVDVLRDLLEPNGELLPLVSNIGEFYAYNTTTVVDILDEKKSKIKWLSPKHTFDQIFQIERYECKADKMEGLSIFRIVERSSSTYVSQIFVDRVREHDLEGFHFIKLWPLPRGVNWQQKDLTERKKKLQIKTDRGATPVKGNTVVIRLPIGKAKPNKLDKDRLAKVMDEIDTLLYDPAAMRGSSYLGSLEGDDVVEGEMRLFLSCPDADALVEKMRPWLKTLSWNGGVKVLKRYGEYVDVKCPEEYAEL